MLLHSALWAVAGLLVSYLPLTTAQSFPTCINTSQYETGTCCMPAGHDLPCPFAGSKEQDNINQNTQDSGEVPSSTILAIRPTTQQEEAKETVVVIPGGPGVGSIIVPNKPGWIFDASSDESKESVSSIASNIGAAMPLASSWAAAPRPATATAAIEALEKVTTQMTDIADRLEGGEKILDCTESKDTPKVEKRQEEGQGVNKSSEAIDKLQRLNCDIVAILKGIEKGEEGKKEVIEKLEDVDQDVEAVVGLTGSLEKTPDNSPENGPNKDTPEPSAGPEAEPEKALDGPPVKDLDKELNKEEDKEEEEAVSTTITELPPEASIQTLNRKDITENMVTTTTREDDDEPTIVPILLPLVGPPVICWSCVSFPAKVQLKLPDLPCVKILGLSIGKCPPSTIEDVQSTDGTKGVHNDNNQNNDNNKDNDKQDDNNTDDNNEDDNNKSEEKNKETSTTCTTTLTATYASVFCSVTGEAAAQRRRQEGGQDCSTLIYDISTACEPVQGSTTTTKIAKPTNFACSPETCGGGEYCLLNKRGVIEKRAPPRPIRLPPNGMMFEPGDYEDASKFMRGEVAKAYQKPEQRVNLAGPVVDDDGTIRSSTTSRFIEFKDKPVSVAVNGLWGCTAVLVISQRGAWLAHYWQDAFPTDILAAGRDDDDEISRYAVGSLRYNPGHPLGDVFNNEYDPKVFIIASEDDLNRGFAADQAIVNGLWGAMGQWWSRGEGWPDPEPPQVVELYVSVHEAARRRFINGEYTQEDMDRRELDNPNGYWDTRFRSPRGKVLVSYQPAVCGQKPMFRVWNDMREIISLDWDPLPSQVYRSRKRQDKADSCDLTRRPEPQDNGTNDNGQDGSTKDTKQEPGEDQTPDVEGKPLKPAVAGMFPIVQSCSNDQRCDDKLCEGDALQGVCVDKDGSKECVCKEKEPPKPVEKQPDTVEEPPKPAGLDKFPFVQRCAADTECDDKLCEGDELVGVCVEKPDNQECVCKEKDPSVCKDDEKCLLLVCKSFEDKKCVDGHCKCQEKKCKNTDECKWKTCPGGKEKVCKDGRCDCKDLYKSGTCRFHITNKGDNKAFRALMVIFDDAGTEIGKADMAKPSKWGETLTVAKDKSKLPYDVSAEFLGERIKRKRDRPPPGGDTVLRFKTYSIRFTAGETKWTTQDTDKNKKPYCSVGKWDSKDWEWDDLSQLALGVKMGEMIESWWGLNGKDDPINSQDMDCYWAC